MQRLFFGNIYNLTVRDALVRLRDRLPSTFILVVRCIDSECEPRALAGLLSLHRVPHKVLAKNLCLTISDAEKAVDCGIFNGFDEVWIYPQAPASLDLAEVPPTTSDAVDFAHGLPSSIAEAIESTNCFLLLADGCGLNFATREDTIAEALSAGPSGEDRREPA